MLRFSEWHDARIRSALPLATIGTQECPNRWSSESHVSLLRHGRVATEVGEANVSSIVSPDNNYLLAKE